MAKNYKNNKYKGNRNKGRFTDAERLAYTLGLIEKGKKNPDSKIYESYNRGLQGQVSKKQKPIA